MRPLAHIPRFFPGVLDSFFFQLPMVCSNALERMYVLSCDFRGEALGAVVVVPAGKGIPWCPKPS
jgi:hypothetical protein